MPENRLYSKVPQSYEALIEKLRSRNLTITNADSAISHLKNIGYYRLIGYGLPLEIKDENEQRTRCFPDTIDFETILNAYIIDRKMRLLLLGAIERIEVAVRNTINHELACKYQNAHWYMDSTLFNESDEFSHSELLRQIKNHTSKSALSGSDREKRREIFIHHYYSQYDEPEYPPCWMVAEILPLGSWSKVYQHLKVSKDRKLISRQFDLAPRTLQSWLHALTYLRNLCAHHARLFGRKLVIRPNNDKGVPFVERNFLYNSICVTHRLLKSISPETSWIDEVHDLLEELPDELLPHYGFETNWLEEPFWLD